MERFDFNKEFEAMMKEKNLKTVVILGHLNPDGDAAGCVMGLSHYVKARYPQYQVYPYLSDSLGKGPGRMIKEDAQFDPYVKPDLLGEDFAVICCDTATRARLIGREYYEGAAVSMVLDHHISNERYGDVNYVKDCEACAEGIFFILNQEDLRRIAKEESYPSAADYIYMGMLHDTDTFSRAEDTTMKAAEALLNMGVDHKRMMQTVQTLTLEKLLLRSELLQTATQALDGQAAYIRVDRKKSLEKNIGYTDIHPLSSMLRDCEDIKMAFTMFEEKENLWRCSLRSDGVWVNVNEILTPFGGGGHASAAGLRTETDDPDKLLKELLARTAEMTK